MRSQEEIVAIKKIIVSGEQQSNSTLSMLDDLAKDDFFGNDPEWLKLEAQMRTTQTLLDSQLEEFKKIVQVNAFDQALKETIK